MLYKLLVTVAGTDTSLDWELLKQQAPFSVPKPTPPALSALPTPLTPLPPNIRIPEPQLKIVEPALPVWSRAERMIPLLRKTKQKEADELTERYKAHAQAAFDLQVRQKQVSESSRRSEEEKFAAKMSEYQMLLQATVACNNEKNAAYVKLSREWLNAKAIFDAEQERFNNGINDLKAKYLGLTLIHPALTSTRF